MSYDDEFGTTIGTIIDAHHDTTSVIVHDTEVHLLVGDQTLSDGLDDDHEPDGGWPDTARGVYTIAEAEQLRDHLTMAIGYALNNQNHPDRPVDTRHESWCLLDNEGDWWVPDDGNWRPVEDGCGPGWRMNIDEIVAEYGIDPRPVVRPCVYCGKQLHLSRGLWTDNTTNWSCADNPSNGGDAAPHEPQE